MNNSLPQGQRLKFLIKKKYSVQEFADMMGYHRATLSGWFKMEVLDDETIRGAARLLGIPESDITGQAFTAKPPYTMKDLEREFADNTDEEIEKVIDGLLDEIERLRAIKRSLAKK